MTKAGSYEKRRDEAAEAVRASSRDGREIGPLPKVKNPRRRKKAAGSLLAFLETYFAGTFHLAWSADQLEVIAEVERVVNGGGQLALAMPRGSGKTSIAVRAALWALLTGRRRFVVLIAAEQGLADNLIAVLRAELQFNEMLAEDWPEVCHPIRRLENITKRQTGQTLDGKPTLIRLTTDELVLPTVKGSEASGGIVRAVGLTGSVRGQVATTGDGRTVRPDLILCDDPQTRDSAKSPTQVSYRLALLNADVLGLAGPGVKVACLALVTVVYPNDLSDKLLDREANPAWQGRRYQMLSSLPDDLQAWDEYAEERRRSLREHGDNRLGNAYYAANRERLDAGAVAPWAARFDPGELSAVQSAMNIKIDRPDAFDSEYQNRPQAERQGTGVKELDPRRVAERTNGEGRFTAPLGTTRVTAFIDLGGAVHWYAVVGWNEHFGGAVIDYGVWPRQTRSVFAAADARPSLKSEFPTHTEEQRVYAGLVGLVPAVLDRTYAGAGNAEFRIDRLLIDAGKWPDAVYKFCRQSPHGGVIRPSKGVGRSLTSQGVGRWKLRPGERGGLHWRETLGVGSGRGRQLQFDPDFWKSFVFAALAVPPGGRSGLTLFGKAADGKRAADHELFAEHCAAEYGEPTPLRGEWFDKWKKAPGRTDNHLWDCLTGCAVAASERGLKWRPEGEDAAPSRPKTPSEPPKRGERVRIKPTRLRV